MVRKSWYFGSNTIRVSLSIMKGEEKAVYERRGGRERETGIVFSGQHWHVKIYGTVTSSQSKFYLPLHSCINGYGARWCGDTTLFSPSPRKSIQYDASLKSCVIRDNEARETLNVALKDDPSWRWRRTSCANFEDEEQVGPASSLFLQIISNCYYWRRRAVFITIKTERAKKKACMRT